jgi:hypothetical protein
VDIPEAGDRRRQLEVSTEAFEARAVREAFGDQAQELLDRLVARIAEVQPAALSTLAARHVDPHRGT